MPRQTPVAVWRPLAIRNLFLSPYFFSRPTYRADMEEEAMDGLIYLVGLIVVIMAILSLFGLR